MKENVIWQNHEKAKDVDRNIQKLKLAPFHTITIRAQTSLLVMRVGTLGLL